MTKKDKEEERVEKIIRGLIKLPENRRCINCNSLGPQYVCTTFFTFVCTSCSGLHQFRRNFEDKKPHYRLNHSLEQQIASLAEEDS